MSLYVFMSFNLVWKMHSLLRLEETLANTVNVLFKYGIGYLKPVSSA